MSTSSPSEVTRILQEAKGDRDEITRALLPLVYEELHAIARRQVGSERRGHTLGATALVHEAYLRLVGGEPLAWQSRGHFFFAAAEAMRRVLVDHARRRGAIKRGGDRRRVPLEALTLGADEDLGGILALDEALLRLDQEDDRAAAVVRLRLFAGLTVEQTALALEVSPRTVKREWTYARAWLRAALRGDDEPTSTGDDR